MFLNIVYVKGIIDIALGRTANWKHLTHEPAPDSVKVQRMIPFFSHLVPAGILLPESIVHTEWFAILATFVAINTVMYAALAAAKILPKLHPGSWLPHATNGPRRAASIPTRSGRNALRTEGHAQSWRGAMDI